MLQLHLGKCRLNGKSFQLLNSNLPVRRGHTWRLGLRGAGNCPRGIVWPAVESVKLGVGIIQQPGCRSQGFWPRWTRSLSTTWLGFSRRGLFLSPELELRTEGNHQCWRAGGKRGGQGEMGTQGRKLTRMLSHVMI